MNEAATLFASMLMAGTPLLIAGLGLLINEKVGVLNLGSEGMMLMGAMTGFAAAFWSQNIWVGLLAGAGAGILLAALFGVLVFFFITNQYATGLAIALFGTGLSAFLGTGFVQERLDVVHTMTFSPLANVPVIGVLCKLHPMVYIAIGMTLGVGWMFYRTRLGLVMRAVGESPESAHALGYPVRMIRFAAVVAGGALCGLAGAFLSVISASMWNDGMTAGAGWIALALTSFATWRPVRILLGAYLFGGVTVLQLYMQTKNFQMPEATGTVMASIARFCYPYLKFFLNPTVMNALPYVATILVLVLISRKPEWIRVNMPASLGKPFYPGG